MKTGIATTCLSAADHALMVGLAELRLSLDDPPQIALRPTFEVHRNWLLVWYEKPVWWQGRRQVILDGPRYGPLEVRLPPPRREDVRAWAAGLADEIRAHAEPGILLGYPEALQWR